MESRVVENFVFSLAIDEGDKFCTYGAGLCCAELKNLHFGPQTEMFLGIV